MLNTLRGLVRYRTRGVRSVAEQGNDGPSALGDLLAPIPAALMRPLVAGSRGKDKLIADILAASADMSS